MANSERRAALDSGDTEAGYRGLTDLFGSDARVFVVEDVHWSDGDTLDLRYLSRRVEAPPLVVVHRDDETGDVAASRAGAVWGRSRPTIAWFGAPVSAACPPGRPDRASRGTRR